MVLEFPSPRNNWKLDAVGLLAVIGETTTETCVEPMTSSWFCLLPRLIPAPQALIRPNRRIKLPRIDAQVTGVYSGTSLPTLSYVANQIFAISNLDPYTVHTVRVTYAKAVNRNRGSDVEMMGSGRQDGLTLPNPAPPNRRLTFREQVENKAPPVPLMKAKLWSPHNIIIVVSFLLTIGLLVWAVLIGDGPATIAIVLLATATTLFCAASLWTAAPTQIPTRSVVPKGDVVIRTRAGAFVIFQCGEDVSRELFFGSDDIRQFISTGFGSCVGVGTIVFMVAVIMMGNCTWTMQAALAVTYLLLNAVYWIAALLPSTTHWVFPRYEWEAAQVVACDSYTDALWRAIFITKRTRWVQRSGAIPESARWDQWLHMAEAQAERGNSDWDAIYYKDLVLSDEHASD